MHTVRCETCASRYRIPDQRVGERGTKIKCPACGSAIVVRPAGAPAQQVDPPTDDWTPEAITDRAPPVIPATDPIPEDMPSAIKAMFAGNGELLTVHPPGTVPPVQRSVAPAPPRVTSVLPRDPVNPSGPVVPGGVPPGMSSRPPSNPPHQALSVTPPPPRAAASPAAFLAMTAERATPPSAAIRASLANPRQARSAHALPSGSPGTIPPPALRDEPVVHRTAPENPARPLDGQRTAPAAPNRPATGGGLPPRGTSESPPEPTPTYAPPWGATPGAPPPWQPYPTGAPAAQAPHPATQYGTQPGVPWAGAYPTHPGAPPWATHPGLTYAPPWGTGVPAGTHPGPPMVTSWQPTWVPAVVLGMERRTLLALLLVVGIVGFVGGCMGVGSSQMAAGLTRLFSGSGSETVFVPGTAPRPRVAVEPAEIDAVPGVPAGEQVPPSGNTPVPGAIPVPGPGAAAVQGGSPRAPVAGPAGAGASPGSAAFATSGTGAGVPPGGGVRVKVVRPASVELRGAAVRPGSAPFDVDPSDVRDPWADPAVPAPRSAP